MLACEFFVFDCVLVAVGVAWPNHLAAFALYFFFFFSRTSIFQLMDKPWSHVSSLLPLVLAFNFLSRIGFSNPTARRCPIECCYISAWWLVTTKLVSLRGISTDSGGAGYKHRCKCRYIVRNTHTRAPGRPAFLVLEKAGSETNPSQGFGAGALRRRAAGVSYVHRRRLARNMADSPRTIISTTLVAPHSRYVDKILRI